MIYNEAIADLGEVLINLLWNGIENDPTAKSIIDSRDKITLSSPDDTESGKLSLFLYRITENIYLKNQEVSGDDPTTIKNPPLFLSLFYLITPHTGKNENDHFLMGKVLQMMHDNSILRGSILQGGLIGEELRLILNPLSIDDLNKVWTIISASKPYKLSISVEITPLRIDSMLIEEVQRVTELELKKYQKEGK